MYQFITRKPDPAIITGRIRKSHSLLDSLAAQAVNLKIVSYETLKAQVRALDIIMAVLDFEEEAWDLPSELNEVQAAGFLQEIPLDPYSGIPMQYEKKNGEFILYSYGRNFDDDAGKEESFWGVMYGQDKDILFWPVKERKSRIRR